MDQVYQGRHIHAGVELNLDTDCWVPTANVSWYEQGKVQHQRLTGVNDHFKIIDDAQIYAVEMAKGWIDSALRFQSKIMRPKEIKEPQLMPAGVQPK